MWALRNEERKRITSFCEHWYLIVGKALSEIQSYKESKDLFSDSMKSKYKREYSELYKSYQSLSKPKREDLKHELEKYEIFSKEYSSIDETQFIHNEVYFSNRSLSLENEYDGLFSSNRFIGHHEIKPFYLRWFQIVDDFFGSPAIFRGRLSKDSAQTIHEEGQI